MIWDFAVLLMFQLAGELIREVFGLPVPGGVIGMFLLLMALVAKLPTPAGLHATSRKFLSYLALLFVPAGTGIITRLSLIGENWLAIFVAVVGSTMVTMVVTALAMLGLERLGSFFAREVKSGNSD